jgi:HEAT repeat protein
MTGRRRIVWVNLGILCILVAGALAIYGMMQGSFGARVYARSLRGGSSADKQRAAMALQNFASRGTPAIPALLDILRNPDDLAAPACARALREIDAQAAYESVNALIVSKPALSPTVIDVFGNFGPVAWRAIPMVRTALDRREHIRELIPALIDMGDYSDEVLAAVVADSRDPVYSVRKWDAMLAFDRLYDLGERIRPELQRLSADSTPAVAGQAKMILSKIGNQPKYASSGLAGFTAANQSYQEYALDRLSKQGARAVDAIPDIAGALHSQSAMIRFMAAWTLMHIGSPARSSLVQLRAAQTDSSSLVRDGAADAIRSIEGAP